MLRLPQSIYDAIVEHARAEHPIEACGVVAGPVGTGRPTRHIPMVNTERSPMFYRMDPVEQLAVWREMDERGEEPVIVYHSHTSTSARPSRTDVEYASEPDAHYVVVSTRDDRLCSYRIVNRQVVVEEQVCLTSG